MILDQLLLLGRDDPALSKTVLFHIGSAFLLGVNADADVDTGGAGVLSASVSATCSVSVRHVY